MPRDDLALTILFIILSGTGQGKSWIYILFPFILISLQKAGLLPGNSSSPIALLLYFPLIALIDDQVNTIRNFKARLMNKMERIQALRADLLRSAADKHPVHHEIAKESGERMVVLALSSHVGNSLPVKERLDAQVSADALLPPIALGRIYYSASPNESLSILVIITRVASVFLLVFLSSPFFFRVSSDLRYSSDVGQEVQRDYGLGGKSDGATQVGMHVDINFDRAHSATRWFSFHRRRDHIPCVYFQGKIVDLPQLVRGFFQGVLCVDEVHALRDFILIREEAPERIYNCRDIMVKQFVNACCLVCFTESLLCVFVCLSAR